MRDYAFYIERAKQAQGFKYDNQLDMALGFKGSMCCILKKGKIHLSDDSMVALARLAKIDPAIGLLDLHMMKTEGETQKVYASLLQKMERTISDTVYYVN